MIESWSSPASCGAWDVGQDCGRDCPHFHLVSSETCGLCNGAGEVTSAEVDGFYQELAVALREMFPHV